MSLESIEEGKQHRLSARMKTEAVLRVHRGDSIDVVSREVGTTDTPDVT